MNCHKVVNRRKRQSRVLVGRYWPVLRQFITALSSYSSPPFLSRFGTGTEAALLGCAMGVVLHKDSHWRSYRVFVTLKSFSVDFLCLASADGIFCQFSIASYWESYCSTTHCTTVSCRPEPVPRLGKGGGRR